MFLLNKIIFDLKIYIYDGKIYNFFMQDDLLRIYHVTSTVHIVNSKIIKR